MSFGCTIILKDGREITSTFGDKESTIHYQLLGLGPNTACATPAPYRVSDFRDAVRGCISPEETMLHLHQMARDNLESLKPHGDCPTCQCPRIDPEGWSVDMLERLLAINPNEVKSIEGGY